MSTQTRTPRTRKKQKETEVRFVPLGSGLFLDREKGNVIVL